MHTSVIQVERLRRKCRQMMAIATVFTVGMTASAYAETVQEGLNRLYPGWTASNLHSASSVDGDVIHTHPVNKTTAATLTYVGPITGSNPVIHLKLAAHPGNGSLGPYDWLFRMRINDQAVGESVVINSSTPVDVEVPLVEWANKGDVKIELDNAPGGIESWNGEHAYWHLIEFKDLGQPYTLEKDEDWTDRSDVFPVVVDLNGHTLKVSRLGDIRLISDSSQEGSGGELRVTVPSGAVVENASASISGSLTFVKDGEGTFVWGGGTIEKTVPILVTNGVFKLGVATANVFGDSGTITVKEKGQFDLNYGVNGGTSPVINKTFEIEGDGPDGSGAIVNTDTTKGSWGYSLKTVNLTGDATIGGTTIISFRGEDCGVNGDYALTIKNTQHVVFCAGARLDVKRIICSDGGIINACCDAPNLFDQVDEGLFLVRDGKFEPWSDGRAYLLTPSVTVEAGETGTIWSWGSRCQFGGTVNVGAGATLALDMTGKSIAGCTFADIVNDGMITGDAKGAKITGTLSGNGVVEAFGLAFGGDNSCWHVECDDAGFVERVNLEQAPEDFLVNLKKVDVLCSGSADEKTYDLAPRGSLTFESLGNMALAVTDATSGLTYPSSTLLIADTRLNLTVVRSDPRPVIAVWTDETGNGNLADPGNWACTNSMGKSVSGVPCEVSDVYLRGECALQFPADTTFTAKSIVANVALTNGCDWSGLTMPVSGTIDLRGNDLALSRLTGGCAISDSSEAGGELRVTVPGGVTNVNASASISGSLTFVKDGEGMLVWGGGTIEKTVPILITNGVFKLGVATANVFGDAGTITVRGKGQFDLNYGVKGGTSPVINKTFEIEGDGPDGSGAIVNTDTTKGDWGYSLKTVNLTGDATIGGTTIISFRGEDCGVNGDYALTIKNTQHVVFCAGAHLDIRRLICSDGGIVQTCCDAPSLFDQVDEGVFLVRGGKFEPWSDGREYLLTPSVTVEAGETGTIWCSGRACQLGGTVNVGTGATLTLTMGGLAANSTFVDVVNNGTIKGAAGTAKITGTLSGNGAIEDADLAFGGDNSCWHIGIDGTTVQRVNLEKASASILTNLKKIEVSYVRAMGYYDLAPAGDLTDELLGQIVLEVKNAHTGHELQKCQLQIKDGRLGVSILNGMVIRVH